MKTLLLVPALLAMTLPSLFGQAPSFASTEVKPGGQVTFRFYAPNASSVSVSGLRRPSPLAMVKTAQGVWEVSVSNLPSDIYGYRFVVDGAEAMDPRNRETKRWVVSENEVEVINGDTPLWAKTAVPHGTVSRHYYTSSLSGREESVFVYTPPGYTPEEKNLPLIVLCHGRGDDESAWIANGRANFIYDNLLAQGRAKRAIVVMGYGHPVLRDDLAADHRPYFERNLQLMENRVLNEVLPMVERVYETRPAPEARAIAGLSMGGGHTLGIGLRHPEVFGWLGAFSAAIPTGEAWQETKGKLAERGTRQSYRLLSLSIGKEDFLIPENQEFTTWLKANQIPYEYILTEGSHEWTVWRAYWADFLQKVFRE